MAPRKDGPDPWTHPDDYTFVYAYVPKGDGEAKTSSGDLSI